MKFPHCRYKILKKDQKVADRKTNVWTDGRETSTAPPSPHKQFAGENMSEIILTGSKTQKSDQGLHYLPFRLHVLDTLRYVKTTIFSQFFRIITAIFIWCANI